MIVFLKFYQQKNHPSQSGSFGFLFFWENSGVSPPAAKARANPHTPKSGGGDQFGKQAFSEEIKTVSA